MGVHKRKDIHIEGNVRPKVGPLSRFVLRTMGEVTGHTPGYTGLVVTSPGLTSDASLVAARGRGRCRSRASQASHESAHSFVLGEDV